jgi:hypothetical protein
MKTSSGEAARSPVQETQTKDSKSFVFGESLQDYLSLGYLYLLLLGISSDSIYYGLIGINILSYSSILDVILSPAVYLTRSLAFPAVIFLTPAIMLIGFRLSLRAHQKNRDKPEYRAKHDVEKLDKIYSRPSMTRGFIRFSAFVIFSAYIGYGLGGGSKLRERLSEGKLKMTHTLTFTDGSEVPVKLIGHNSNYVFYVKEGMKVVSVTPLSGNIKVIEEK